MCAYCNLAERVTYECVTLRASDCPRQVNVASLVDYERRQSRDLLVKGCASVMNVVRRALCQDQTVLPALSDSEGAWYGIARPVVESDDG